MAPMRLSISLIAVLITLCERRAHGFVAPVPVGRRPNAGIAASAGTKSLADGFQARPQQPRAYDTSRWQTSMSAAPGHTPSGISGEESARPASRLSRISGRVRKMIRKAIMGYVPEEELSYKQRAAQQAAAAAKLRGEPEIADERLRGASMAAKAAAIETVEKSVLAEDDEDDFLLNSNFVQLDIGNQSPMEAEDKLASLRKRLEQGLPPDTAQEQAEKRRQAMEQQFRLQKQNERSSKPPSFDGDTAVAERPSSALGAHQQRADEGASRPKAPRETPKLAAAEDVERLNRMFGSMGGEPLR